MGNTIPVLMHLTVWSVRDEKKAMAKKKKKKFSDDVWSSAMTTYHLSARQIEMAKKLGMNPKKFGSLVPNKSEPWKKPLGQFIESCYYKRFKKPNHEDVR